MKICSKQYVLKTARLILKPFVLDDAPEVKAICSNKTISDTTAHVPHPYSVEMAIKWI